ncbi:hypothetical protein AAC387_Pa03g3549 [Persea americana]
MAFHCWFVFLLLVSLCNNRVESEPTQDKQALLLFLSKIPHENRIVWNASDSACNWVGVGCDRSRSFVYSLRLPGVGLIGQIPNGTIGNLTRLRILSLRSNRLSGVLPPDFSNLMLLHSLFLQNNLFSGGFPESLTGLTRLTRLDISSNRFTGEIPSSVGNLTRLTGLFLQSNGFSGTLPSINISSLQNFNVSYNNLNGSIPEPLERFQESSFAGNVGLCGKPLTPCSSITPSPAPENPSNFPTGKPSKKLSKAAIIGISVGGGAALLLLFALILFFCFRGRARGQQPAKPPVAVATSAVPGAASTSSEIGLGGLELERNKLVFLDGAVYGFDLEDLLRASAEVLGKGSVGTSYKAVLDEGTTVVVKRLKDVAVSKKDFEQQVRLLGKIKHENVVSLRAFYYAKDEKLLVSDFMEAGSLSAILHGSRGSGRTLLSWEQRVKIALCTARGLAHLHHSAAVVHGNIKSSNILLRPNLDACISDYGLHPLFAPSAPPSRVAGYRAPEVLETRKPTSKSDVYSYGVLLLELLTGKPPNQALVGDDGLDLPRWVQSVVREEWTAEVFDAELVKYGSSEEEMVQLLQVAMACVSTVPDQRPPIEQVVSEIEELHEKSKLESPKAGFDPQTPTSD